MPDQVFISYAHADREWMEEFCRMLAPAANKGLVDVWSDQLIQPGDDWQEKIRDSLVRARVALLLVTSEFLSSPFIREKELRNILAAANDGALQIYWVPISDSLVEYTDLGNVQAASDPKQPLAGLSEPERRNAVAEICRKLLDQLGQLPVVTRDDRGLLQSSVSERLKRKYELIGEIGTGTTSIVFKARDKDFDRVVAIKALVGSALQPHCQEVFQKQVEVAYQLTSPAYLRIFDHLLDEWPRVVVSEYTTGSGLGRYLELAHPVPPRRVKTILVDLATALCEAHQKGYLHGGLTPSNVYIDDSHRPRLSAFRFTTMGPDVGRWGTFSINHETCTFLSPEQFYGHPRSPLSDQYALGLIGRELLTGRSIEPIHCPADFVKRPQLFQDLANEEPTSVSELSGIIWRMLSVDPADRWASMQEIVELLDVAVVHDTDTDRLRRETIASYVRIQAGAGAKRLYDAVYRHLFLLAPAVKTYFSDTIMEKQFVAMNHGIKHLLDYNPANPATVSAIRELARKHERFRLTAQHLDAFKQALLAALAEVGETPRVLQAWDQTVSLGLEEMRRVLSCLAQTEAVSTGAVRLTRRSLLSA